MSEEKGISKNDLKEILAHVAAENAANLERIISEMKKPTVLEQVQLDKDAQALRSANEERKANASGVLMQAEQNRNTQKWCSHKHPAAHGGHSHFVLVTEQGNPFGYLLCQLCHVQIRPEPAPKDYKGTNVYDTRQYNEGVQTIPSSALFQ